MWDLSTALELATSGRRPSSSEHEQLGGPTPDELLRVLDGCDISSSSRRTTPTVSPSPSLASANFPSHNVTTPLTVRKRPTAPEHGDAHVTQAAANQRSVNTKQDTGDDSMKQAEDATSNQVKL